LLLLLLLFILYKKEIEPYLIIEIGTFSDSNHSEDKSGGARLKSINGNGLTPVGTKCQLP
jgi:hypothetical protein